MRGRLVLTRNSPFSFDGHCWHATQPFSGECWVITCLSLPVGSLASLHGFGFPYGPQIQDAVPGAPQEPELALPQAPQFFLDLFSGGHSPLANAARAMNIPCLAIDILLDKSHDLLDVICFERILRLAFSGKISFGHASPPCTEYTLLKLLPGPGPRPCRSADHLQGLPTNDAEAQTRVETSFLLLHRVVMILMAVFQAGGHVSLEQPRNALSWLEPVVRAFLLDISADLVVVAGCAFGMNYAKQWIFASSWRPLQSLASVCPHAAYFHPPVAGVRSERGSFRSRETAEFPVELASQFVGCILPLFEGRPSTQMLQPKSLSLPGLLSSLPVRREASFPLATQDGGGIYSVPDWAFPPKGIPAVFKEIRQQLHATFARLRAPLRLRQRVADKVNGPLFDAQEVARFRSIWDDWFRARGFYETVDCVEFQKVGVVTFIRVLSL